MLRSIALVLALTFAPSALACGMYMPEERRLLAEVLEEIDKPAAAEVVAAPVEAAAVIPEVVEAAEQPSTDAQADAAPVDPEPVESVGKKNRRPKS